MTRDQGQDWDETDGTDAGTGPAAPPIGVTGGSTQQRLAHVGETIRASFGRVLAELPGAPLKAIEVSRALRINKDVSSRIVKAVGQSDPIAILHHAPGPSPMQKMLDAAAKRSVSREAIQIARDAVEEFQRAIDEEAGDRAALDSMISGWLPEAREKNEYLARQTAYRGMTLIKGLSVEVACTAAVIRRSTTNPPLLDFAAVMGVCGLRALSPTASMRAGSWALQSPDGHERRGLDGAPAESVNDLRLLEYCSRPLVEYRGEVSGGSVLYTVTPPDIGLGHAMDSVTAELQLGALSPFIRPQSKGDGHAFISHEVTIPTRVAVLDVLVPEGVWDEAEPWCEQIDLVPHGLGDINDPLRKSDRSVGPAVQRCGTGVGGLRIGEVPWYADMVSDVCRRIEVDPRMLRAYRLRVEYPVYGQQMCMVFRRPKPAQA